MLTIGIAAIFIFILILVSACLVCKPEEERAYEDEEQDAWIRTYMETKRTKKTVEV